MMLHAQDKGSVALEALSIMLPYARLEEHLIIDYEAKLRHFAQLNHPYPHKSPKRKAIHLTMLTTYGVAHNAYWNNIQSEVTMDDLFKESR